MRVLALALLSLTACQGYDFVFQPDSRRDGVHLRFAVEQPSKADILFVVDNTPTMAEERRALESSITGLLKVLAVQDTSYRIGIVSMDAFGRNVDCFGDPLPLDPTKGGYGIGDCDRNIAGDPVVLRYPNDGVNGRLIAAFDHKAFEEARDSLIGAQAPAAFLLLAPTAVDDGPVSVNGKKGVPAVIDREIVQADACVACTSVLGSCDCGDKTGLCYTSCAAPVAAALVSAYFRSNVRGLGSAGVGYEEALLSSARAVGIDPDEISDTLALAPADALTGPGEPNEHMSLDDNGIPVASSWVRDEALLAIMFVTDEDECSIAKTERIDFGDTYETGRSGGIGCYNGPSEEPDTRDLRLMSVDSIADRITLKKTTDARVAVGFIGGVRQSGSGLHPERQGTAGDCAAVTRVPLGPDGKPSSECSCLNGLLQPSECSGCLAGEQCVGADWCLVTQVQAVVPDTCAHLDGAGVAIPPSGTCDALSGSRYVQFANHYDRRTFDSVCRVDVDSGIPCASDAQCDAAHGYYCYTDPDTSVSQCRADFGPALADFAKIATLACFDLAPGAQPARQEPENLLVQRAARLDAGAGIKPADMPYVTDSGSSTTGWYYEPAETKDDNARVCLTGVDRLIGDVYDIFVLTNDDIGR